MNWQFVRLAEVPATPWRNGGGFTRELLARPQTTDWDWRISVAEVASSGPFSCFAGVRRWLAILRGAGVRLEMAERAILLDPCSEALEFDGAESVQCQLLDGPVEDINLMLRCTGARSGRMQRISGAAEVRIAAQRTVALYAPAAAAMVKEVDGVECAVPPAVLAWRRVSAALTVRIQAVDAIWMEIDH